MKCTAAFSLIFLVLSYVSAIDLDLTQLPMIFFMPTPIETHAKDHCQTLWFNSTTMVKESSFPEITRQSILRRDAIVEEVKDKVKNKWGFDVSTEDKKIYAAMNNVFYDYIRPSMSVNIYEEPHVMISLTDLKDLNCGFIHIPYRWRNW